MIQFILNYILSLLPNNPTSYIAEYSCGYINNSRHLAQKHARIFFRGHYLFREVNSFSRAKLEENCELRGTDSAQGQISASIFSPQMATIVLIIKNYNFLACDWFKNVLFSTNSLAKLLSDSLLSDSLLLDSLLSDSLRWPNTVFKSLCLILHNF